MINLIIHPFLDASFHSSNDDSCGIDVNVFCLLFLFILSFSTYMSRLSTEKIRKYNVYYCMFLSCHVLFFRVNPHAIVA